MTSLLTGTMLRALRSEHGLTQADLADKLGYSERWIRAWEAGNHPIPDAAADAIPGIIRDIIRTRARQQERLRRLLSNPNESISA